MIASVHQDDLDPSLWIFRNFRAPVTTLIRKER